MSEAAEQLRRKVRETPAAAAKNEEVAVKRVKTEPILPVLLEPPASGESGNLPPGDALSHDVLINRFNLAKKGRLKLSKGEAERLKRILDSGFDPLKSGAFSVQPNVAQGAPWLAVDLRKEGLVGAVKNQESVGSCTAFALSSAADSQARILGQPYVFSAMHI